MIVVIINNQEIILLSYASLVINKYIKICKDIKKKILNIEVKINY